jgi:hypothetical protein
MRDSLNMIFKKPDPNPQTIPINYAEKAAKPE